MFTTLTTSKKMVGLVLAGGLITILAGCGQTPAERALLMRQQELAAQRSAQHALGAGSLAANPGLSAGDSLGLALFDASQDDSTGLAMFRQADAAFAVAEAKEQEGTYDNWYASFERVDDNTAIAAKQPTAPNAVAATDE